MADLLAFFVLWTVGWWLLWRVPVPGAAKTAQTAWSSARPPVSVIVPARDEEHRLPLLLASLEGQLGAGDQIIVVDDGSGDATAAVAREAGALVVVAPPLPAGWVGKVWACHVGSGAAANPLLVFLDADTEIAPGGLDRLVAHVTPDVGLLSVQPYHRVPRLAERMAAFFNVVGMMGTGAFTPAPRRPPAGAFGPCLVTTADDYTRAGGHSSVWCEVIDDVALARRYTAAGLPVRVLGGRGTVSFRMYPDGLGALVEGFTKNLASGARATRPTNILLIAGWLAACTAPVVLASRLPLLIAAACYLSVAVQLHLHLRRLGSFGMVTAFLYLVPLAVFFLVFLRSVGHTALRRRVRWKGRDVDLRRQRADPGS